VRSASIESREIALDRQNRSDAMMQGDQQNPSLQPDNQGLAAMQALLVCRV
jgi:hypothetical protein